MDKNSACLSLKRRARLIKVFFLINKYKEKWTVKSRTKRFDKKSGEKKILKKQNKKKKFKKRKTNKKRKTTKKSGDDRSHLT